MIFLVEEMKLQLNDLGAINEAEINIKKITVVGGPNASGKSTLSKFLYSFLRSNSFNRREIAMKSLSKVLREDLRYMEQTLKRMDLVDEDFRVRIPSIKAPRFNVIIEIYEVLKSEILELTLPSDLRDKFTRKFNKIDDLIEMIENDDGRLYVSILRNLLKSEFSTNDFSFYADITNDSPDYSFDFEIDFKNHDLTSDDAFKSTGGFMLDEVYYIDSVSILDLFQSRFAFRKNDVDHIEFLKDKLLKGRGEPEDIFDDKINSEIISLESEIGEVINGRFIYEDGEFIYSSGSDVASEMHNTASGIKQIGIIQLLLANRRLKEDCFLIIDEPEVNLHPDWQIRFAEILILLVKKLNVSLYINTHSPLFIEAVSTFSAYYELEDKTSYHLTEKSGSHFNISEVDAGELSRIFDNLGRPYMTLDMIRLEKELE